MLAFKNMTLHILGVASSDGLSPGFLDQGRSAIYLKFSHQRGDDFIVTNLDCILIPNATSAGKLRYFSLLGVVLVGCQFLGERDVSHCTVVGFGQQQVITEAVEVFAFEDFVVGTVAMWTGCGLGGRSDMFQLWTLDVAIALRLVAALTLTFQVHFIFP